MTTLETETIGEGLDVILIHGWAMPALVWHNTARALAKHYRVTTLNLPGYGASSALDNTTLSTLSEHLVRQLPQPAVWIGWSLGGLIAMHIARHYPEHTKALITIASLPKFVKDETWPAGIESQIFSRFAHSLENDYHGVLQRFIALQELSSENSRLVIRQLRKIIALSQRPTLETLRAGLDILSHTDLRNDMADLRCPFLQIVGEKDSIIPASAALHLAKAYPRTKLCIIRGRGHAPFLPTSTQVVNTVCDFIEHNL